MSIVDRFGNPLSERHRKALGFMERTLPEREQETVNGVAPPSDKSVRPEFPMHDAEEPYGHRRGRS